MATLYSTALSILAPVVDNGVLPGDPRVAARLDEAQRRLIQQYNFVSHREESLETPLIWQAGGTNPGNSNSELILDEIDSTKLMILCAFREENNQLEMADGMEKKAFGYVERNVVNQVERARYTQFSSLALASQNTFGGLVGRLGLEIFSSYKVPYTRMQSYVNQAYQEAVDHYNFIVRNEQYDLSALPWNPLTSDTDTFPTLITAEVIRGLTLALLVQNNDTETQYTSGKEIQTFKEDSLKLIERNIAASVESSRKAQFITLAATDQNTFGGLVGRLGLETFAQYKVPYVRLQSFVNQAYQQAIDHFNSLVGDEQADLPQLTFSALVRDSDAFNPTMPVEVIRLLVLALLAQDSSGQESPLKAQAFTLLQRNVTQQVHSVRFATRKALAAGDPTTFGYHWARVSLDLPDSGLEFSDAQLKRIVNTAEEQLMNAGKWVGTVDTYSFNVAQSGETYLPLEIETVLFASFGGSLQPVHDRFNEWMTNGGGLRTADQPWRSGLLDRGEGIDPEDGKLKRKYFISLSSSQFDLTSPNQSNAAYAPY
jgi:hypothetical protein